MTEFRWPQARHVASTLRQPFFRIWPSVIQGMGLGDQPILLPIAELKLEQVSDLQRSGRRFDLLQGEPAFDFREEGLVRAWDWLGNPQRRTPACPCGIHPGLNVIWTEWISLSANRQRPVEDTEAPLEGYAKHETERMASDVESPLMLNFRCIGASKTRHIRNETLTLFVRAEVV